MNPIFRMRPISRSPLRRQALTALLWLVAGIGTVAADELRYEVTGIDGELRANVLSWVNSVQLGRQARLSERDFDRVIADTSRRAREALRPLGYYHPEVSGRIRRTGDEELLLTLDVRRGPPMRVDAVDIEITGDGRKMRRLKQWKEAWPLPPGSLLNQSVWEAEKQSALELAAAQGYRHAEFTRHNLQVDLIENRATLLLTLDTGPQYVFGDIDFGEHILKPGILEFLPRFRKGEAFSARLLNEFRLDLWKTGFFTSVDVIETERPDGEPPAVDLRVELETTAKNFYQGSVGLGTDTGARVQAQWSRKPVSRNGDRLDVGIGWQQADDEFSIHGNYRLPIRSRARQYWTLELFQRFENLDLEIKQQPEDEDYINIANGKVNEFHVRGGRLKVRNRKSGDQQLLATLFMQYLNSTREFTLNELLLIPASSISDPALDDLLKDTDNAISVGVDLDLIGVTGKGWETHGQRDRFWVFVGDNATGSDTNFAQIYLSSRRSYLKGDRWKFLLRAELGYTEAKVDRISIDTVEQTIDLSVTRLPNFYRFKAGGSQSVRGYGFEALSNNDVGSNNIVTASAEIEMRIFQKWSIATFFDIGDAFNDWNTMDLRKGVGAGIRWYSIAGPISIDVARALDFEGKPWRLHFTIGTPLL